MEILLIFFHSTCKERERAWHTQVPHCPQVKKGPLIFNLFEELSLNLLQKHWWRLLGPRQTTCHTQPQEWFGTVSAWHRHEIPIFHVSFSWKFSCRSLELWQTGVGVLKDVGSAELPSSEAGFRASYHLGLTTATAWVPARMGHQGCKPETPLVLVPMWPLARWGAGSELQRKFSWEAAWCLLKLHNNQRSYTDSDFKLALADGKNAVSEYAQPTCLNIKWWRTFPESTVSRCRKSAKPGPLHIFLSDPMPTSKYQPFKAIYVQRSSTNLLYLWHSYFIRSKMLKHHNIGASLITMTLSAFEN